MAKVGNPTKAKWIYALNLEPIDKMKPKELYQLTTDLTECPYKDYLTQSKPSGPQVIFQSHNFLNNIYKSELNLLF